ncbi:MAG TPA: sulfur carrier protein ThiS [Burkholderiaceae bacterium]|jgi:sulfur carrier protein|nr:sulfur carrier protein ThiS [Burkholderiaceae bacterium]
MKEERTIGVVLDGGPRRIAAGTTLAALVAELGHAPGAVGTAVNGRFVARGLREGLELSSGDSILLFQPITGG